MKITLDSIVSGFKSVTKLISNFDKIEDDLNNKVLYRDNPEGEPNYMQNDLDMNSYNIINQGNPVEVSGFNWTGDWSSLTTYAVGDAVHSNGTAYIAIAASTNQTPPNGTYWQIVAEANYPTQTGNADKALTTDGSAASWGSIHADHVDFTNSGTGGVERTLQAKLEDVVNVKDFGAVGDGVTDDTQAIRDAIDAGSEIYFPAGSYYCAVDGNITKNGVTNKRIYGDGATLLKGGSKGVFYFLNSSNIEIHGLNFNGNVTADEAANGSILAATRASTDYAFAVVFEECSDCSFHDNYVYDFAWDGCVAYGIVAAGAASATYSSNIRVFRNRFRNIRGTMIWNKAVKNLWIAENNGTNDTGGSPFEQKGNFIFCVEFCDKVNIDQNHAYYIGDNFVGIGDQINDTSQALNRNITVTNNLFKTCRYHAILIAQVRDAVISGNIIEQAGAKDNMFPSSAVQCAGITMIGGVDGSRASQPNSNVSIVNNVIYEPYEMGVYAFDRGLTALSGGSTGITISGNKIIRAGQLALATRMTTRGITCQFPNMVVITDNVVKDVAGEGVRVFGDARLQRNEVYNSDDISIHVPDDTIFNNVSLSAVVADNVCVGSKRSGILIAGRQVTKTRGNKCEECGIDTVPVSETVATAYLYSGIGVYKTDHYLSEGDECNENGSSGICYRPSGSSLNKVRITNAMTSDNGSVFTTANLRSGVYAEGDGTTAVAATYIGCGGYTGTNQQYPIRQVFGGASVSVDDVFDTHPNGILGATQKSLINI